MSAHKPYDEKEVLELLGQGSEYAFTQLFDHYNGQILNAALRFLKSRELAEEVVQEVFLKVWVKREEMVKAVNFEGYLFTMARNQVFDGIKLLAKETTTKKEFARGVGQVGGTDHPLIEKQYQELLLEAVDLLPPQQKQIFNLAKIEGLSHQAIAEQLHISRLTVKTHMAKALQSIRQKLQRHITTFTLLPVILSLFTL
jgi:RNA polymerase sigma-70 factor (ECF subfamily)